MTRCVTKRCRHAWNFIDRKSLGEPARIQVRDPRPEPGAVEQYNCGGLLPDIVHRLRPGNYRFLGITGWCGLCGAVRLRDPKGRKRIFRPQREVSGGQ